MRARVRILSVITTAVVGAGGLAACEPAQPPVPQVPVDNTVVLRFETHAPNAPPWVALQETPDVTVFADGRVVRAARSGPGRMSLYSVVQLDSVGLGQVMAQATAAGVGQSGSYMGPLVCDAEAPITTISYSWNGAAATTLVADLGDSSVGVSCVVPAEEVAFRSRVTGLRSWLGSVEGSLAGNVVRGVRPYASAGVALMWWGRDAQADLDVVAWPSALVGPARNPSAELRGSLCEIRTSFVDVLGSWLMGLRTTVDTVWLTSSGPYRLAVRPLLGDETSSASLG